MVKIDGENFIMCLFLEDFVLCIKRENFSLYKEKVSVVLYGGLEFCCFWWIIGDEYIEIIIILWIVFECFGKYFK